MASPKLRFKAFDGDWRSVSLLEISTLITKGTTPKQFIDGNINFLKIEAITQNGFELSKCQTISEEINNKELKRSILMEGDILFAIAGATIGKNAIVQKELLPANTNQALAIIRLKENYSKVFISKVLNSPLMEKYIDINISTGAQPNLNLQQIGSFSFTLPNLEEQTKIATFLSAVDEKISQLSQKLHLLGQYKQGMMQKLFSQQIRFKANDGSEFGDWEILKFKDVITIKYGKDHKKLKDGDIPVLGTGGIMRYVDSYLYDGESILIGRKGTIDKPQFISGKFWTVDTLFYTEIGEKIRPKFAFQQLLLVNWLNLNEATGVPSLNTTSIGNIELKVPSLEEQTKIANFLSAIDQKIDVVSEQLEQAKLWKKGLLQQMFV